MQPPERSTGGVPVAGGPAPAVVGGKPRNRRLRLWLAMGLGIVVLLCLGGVGVAISLYDGATKIQRSEPDAVADSFLRAYLVNRDDKEAALFMCKEGGNFAQISAFRADIVSREQKFSIAVRVSWTSLVVNTVGNDATVTTSIVRAISDGTERTSDPWQLALIDQGGWRVCGAKPSA
jgi:hypothetical protein